jgi:predicted Zn-dependent protease
MSTPLGFKINTPEPSWHSFLQRFSQECDWVAIRRVKEVTHQRSFRNQKSERQNTTVDCGVMIEVLSNGQLAYSGTSDFSEQGISEAFTKALKQAKTLSAHKLFPFNKELRPSQKGTFSPIVYQSLDSELLSDFCAFLQEASKHLKVSDEVSSTKSATRIVDWDQLYLSSTGTDIHQSATFVTFDYSATATWGNESQTRSTAGGLHNSFQSGLEVLDRKLLKDQCQKIGWEAVALAKAPNCPTGTMALLLAPDQMLMQIHESIGHPLELDRILGDERNFAGWSFVRPTDFGVLKYGSDLMNVVFDPTYPGEFACYSFDDGGNPARKEYLIKKGILQRGLGSLESQARLKSPGVANFRSASWNRAPIDRMANINLEPGSSSLQQMIQDTEKGILMKSNVSWSIDDYRHKFQFGCEFGQLIENGKLTSVVKNPNYRGTTVAFWNSLSHVGSSEEFEIYGSPFCGKGEPSQVIRVGHGSPPCLFQNVSVFGGGQ